MYVFPTSVLVRRVPFPFHLPGAPSSPIQYIPTPFFSCLWGGVDSLLNGPLHGLVCDEQRNAEVEDLTAGTAEGVEDSGVESSGKRVLTVLGEAVVDDALLGGRAWYWVRTSLVMAVARSGFVLVISAYQGHPRVRGSYDNVSKAFHSYSCIRCLRAMV